MSSTPYFDIHAHIFHPKIAHKVVTQLQQHYKIPPIGTGEFADLLPRLKRASIDQVCIHSAATNAAQVIPANRWTVSLLQYPEIIPFGTLHPDYDKMSDELAFLHNKGIKGIKMHPDFQGFRLDDPKLLPIFAEMEGYFTLMVHIGDTLPPELNPSCPYKVAAIKKQFPKLQIIAPHFGGYRHWQHVIKAIKGLEIYLDTSSSLFAIEEELLNYIYQNHPKEYILFGSDYPLFDPTDEIERLQRRLKLSDKELHKILSNASRLELT